MPDSASKKITIQIPCYNEAETLPDVLADLRRELSSSGLYDVIVIDDGSTDDTGTTAQRHLANHVVTHNINRGLSAAFQTGIAACLSRSADIIVNVDGDGQYDFQDLPSLILPIASGEADLVVGDRRPSRNGDFSFVKRSLQRCGAIFVGLLVGQWVPDPVSGFRAMTAAEARRVRGTNRFSYTVETLMRSIWGGSRVVFVPVSTNPTTRPSRLCRGNWRFCARQGGIAVRTLASILWQRYRPRRGGERSLRPLIPTVTPAASVVR